jgi:hypothetical protein
VNSENKEKARLNTISHLLSQIPYKSIKREKVKFPKRGKPRYRGPREMIATPVPEKY